MRPILAGVVKELAKGAVQINLRRNKKKT